MFSHKFIPEATKLRHRKYLMNIETLFPASAQKGSLLTRDHFNGCIRNVMIGGERRDWTDMAELHNIHLSSCPVQ